MLQAALSYAELGYPVVRCAANGRRPTTRHGKDDATTDPREIRQLFTRPANVGILPPPGVLVLDNDVAKDGRPESERIAEANDRFERLVREYPELNRAPWAKSARGGDHLFVRLPVGITMPSSVKPTPGVDLRGDGRTYIVAAPSFTGDGAYRWVRPLVRPEELPLASEELLQTLRRPAPTSRREEAQAANTAFASDSATTKEITDPIEFARGLLEGVLTRLSSVAEGARHNETLKETRILGRWVAGYELAGLDGLNDRDARAVLEKATVANGYARDASCCSTITDGLRYGMADPFKVVARRPSARVHVPQRGHAAMTSPSVDTELQINGDETYLLDTYLAELDRRYERPSQAAAVGLAGIDALLDGGYHEGLHILAGLTGGGKTSFALRLAYLSAMQARPVVYASYEQSKHELWSRLATHVTGIPYGALKRGAYFEQNGDRLPSRDVLSQHQQWPSILEASKLLHVLEAGDALSRQESGYTIEALQRLADRLRRESGLPPLIIADYLQRMPAKELANREIRERVGYVAGMLQVGIAREIGCPVLALSSLNRARYRQNAEGMTHEDRLASLKESGEVEYSAYTVAVIYPPAEGREPRHLIPTARSRGLHFDLVKNREGKVGRVDLRWSPIGDKWEEAGSS